MPEKKGMKNLDLDPTGRYVAEAVRTLRQNQDLTYKELEERLTANGHRIPALGLRRIESEARRVDVDDLMALAAALNVSPLRLLLHIPDEGQGAPYQVATGVPEDLSWNEAAAWVRDETGLSIAQRIEFWRAQVRTLTRMLDENELRITELREQCSKHPDDRVLWDRLHWEEGLLSQADHNLAESVDMLEALEARQKQNGGSSDD